MNLGYWAWAQPESEPGIDDLMMRRFFRHLGGPIHLGHFKEMKLHPADQGTHSGYEPQPTIR